MELTERFNITKCIEKMGNNGHHSFPISVKREICLSSIWLGGIETVWVQKLHTKNRWNLHAYTTYLQSFKNK